MQLHCPNCQTPIPVNHINIERMAAVCPNCAEVFSFADRISTRKSKPTERKFKQPAEVDIIEGVDRLTIQTPLLPHSGAKRWTSIAASLVLMAVGVLFCFGVLARSELMARVMYELMRLQYPAVFSQFRPEYMLGTVLLFLVLGLPALVGGLAILFNKRQVIVDVDSLQARYTPLGLGGNHYRREDITHVITQMDTSKTMIRERRYDVDVVLMNGKQRTFVRNIPADQAQFIAQEVNRYLAGDEAGTNANPFVETAAVAKVEAHLVDIRSTGDAPLMTVSDDHYTTNGNHATKR